MKTTVLSILFVLGAVIGARADTSTYYWQGKGPWNDAQLQAAAQVCDQHYGVVENGAVTSANYKRCMLKQGWKYGKHGPRARANLHRSRHRDELSKRRRRGDLRATARHREIYQQARLELHANGRHVGLFEPLTETASLKGYGPIRQSHGYRVSAPF